MEETKQPREQDLPVTVFSWPGHTATCTHEEEMVHSRVTAGSLKENLLLSANYIKRGRSFTALLVNITFRFIIHTF